MSASNPIIALLENESLTGDNFVKWKSNVNNVLVCEPDSSNRFVLTEECPAEPIANVARSVRESYERWIQANNKARAYMLASMSDMLRLKHERMETAIEIMDSLQNMFRKQSEQSRHEATRKYMNTKISKGTPVRDHVLNMANYINEAELQGAIIDERTQVSIILDSLTPDFLQFTSNYVMNKLDYNVTQLLNELQTFEAISKTITKKAEANVAETKASSSSNNKKNRKNNKGASARRPKKKQAAPKASDKKKGSNEKKPKGKCFHCGVDGHWKRNYNKYLLTEGQKER